MIKIIVATLRMTTTYFCLFNLKGSASNDPNGANFYAQDYRTWQAIGGFFINTAGSNGQEIATWTTRNPGGTAGGGNPSATIAFSLKEPDASASAYYNVGFDVGVCSLYIGGGIIGGSAAGPAGTIGGGLVGTAACAQQIKGDWDNVSSVASSLWNEIQSLGNAAGDDLSNADSGASIDNSLFGGSNLTGAEQIYTPDGLTWYGTDTGGFGEGDSFSASTGGSPMVINYFSSSRLQFGHH